MNRRTIVTLAALATTALLGACAGTPNTASNDSQYRTSVSQVKPWAYQNGLDIYPQFSGVAMASDGLGYKVDRQVAVARAAKLRKAPSNDAGRIEFASVPTSTSNEP